MSTRASCHDVFQCVDHSDVVELFPFQVCSVKLSCLNFRYLFIDIFAPMVHIEGDVILCVL